jgi:hypothetical protein
MSKKVPLERDYQPHVIKRVELLLPHSYVRKVDVQPGWPDLLILAPHFWAFLEVKRQRPSPSDYEPNQPWWIEHLNDMSFAACIYPEIEEEVLNDLQRAFQASRPARSAERLTVELDSI